MDFLFLLEQPWEESTGSLRLAFGVRITGDSDSWAEKHPQFIVSPTMLIK